MSFLINTSDVSIYINSNLLKLLSNTTKNTQLQMGPAVTVLFFS